MVLLASRRTAAALRASVARGASRPPRRLSQLASFSHTPRCPLSLRPSASLPSLTRTCTHTRTYCSSHGTSPAGTTPPAPPPPDHRDLGVQQELFTTSPYSPGSPIFLPNGARIFNRLVDFLRKQYVRYGFQEVITPTIYKKSLWAKSGHLDNYADDMFTVMSASLATGEQRVDSSSEEEASETAGAHEYGLKPMNCPGHCLIFAAQRHSYRDLPIRYADFSPLHRDEISGALSGLTRVRRFHQDDGHIFCRPSQVEDEIRATLDFVQFTYGVLGLGPYRLVLSTRPTDGHLIGSTADWDAAEDALRRALDHSGQAWTVSAGDGAFYGPKIDIVLQDSDGKEHQTATVQLDFQLPRRFELSYHAPSPELERQGVSVDDVPADGGKEEAGPVTPVMIHRAVLGSVERLMALLIEHYNGRWPFWLNPRQVAVLTVNDSAAVVGFAQQVQGILSGAAAGTLSSSSSSSSSSGPLLAAVDLDTSPRTLPLKVREAKAKGYGAIVVVGPKDVAKGTVAVDLSGIPVKDVGDGTAVAEDDAKSKKKTVEMKPEALLQLLQERVQTYQ